MWPNPQFSADLVTFTQEVLNEKLHFLRGTLCQSLQEALPVPSIQKITIVWISLLLLGLHEKYWFYWVVIYISHRGVYFRKQLHLDGWEGSESCGSILQNNCCKKTHGIFIVNFEHIPHIVLVFLLLTLNM